MICCDQLLWPSCIFFRLASRHKGRIGGLYTPPSVLFTHQYSAGPPRPPPPPPPPPPGGWAWLEIASRLKAARLATAAQVRNVMAFPLFRAHQCAPLQKLGKPGRDCNRAAGAGDTLRGFLQ